MAEEDLIFGKNRHFFGGIEPSNMLGFVVANRYDSEAKKPTVLIKAKLPKDTVIDDQTLCSVAGAVIRRSVDKYPEDEFDGEYIATIKEDKDITDSNVEVGKLYCYKAFPFTTQGVYNRNLKKNRSKVTVTDDGGGGDDPVTPGGGDPYTVDLKNTWADPVNNTYEGSSENITEFSVSKWNNNIVVGKWTLSTTNDYIHTENKVVFHKEASPFYIEQIVSKSADQTEHVNNYMTISLDTHNCKYMYITGEKNSIDFGFTINGGNNVTIETEGSFEQKVDLEALDISGTITLSIGAGTMGSSSGRYGRITGIRFDNGSTSSTSANSLLMTSMLSQSSGPSNSELMDAITSLQEQVSALADEVKSLKEEG